MYSRPQWPTLDEQLKAAQVRRGSALEQLIRENQDFDLLDPREAADDADLPLWLRVFWRKNHPDVQHSTVNPGGGYPDVLYNIYERMLENPDFPWGSPEAPEGGPPTSPEAEGPGRDRPRPPRADSEDSQPAPPHQSGEPGRKPRSRKRDA